MNEGEPRPTSTPAAEGDSTGDSKNTYNMNEIEAHQARERRLLLWASAACGTTLALLTAAPAWAITGGGLVAAVSLGTRAWDRRYGTSGPGEITDDLLTNLAAACTGFAAGAIGTTAGLPQSSGWATLGIQALMLARWIRLRRSEPPGNSRVQVVRVKRKAL